jgi:hypothetical protein
MGLRLLTRRIEDKFVKNRVHVCLQPNDRDRDTESITSYRWAQKVFDDHRTSDCGHRSAVRRFAVAGRRAGPRRSPAAHHRRSDEEWEMTAQLADEIRFRGRLYAITAVDGDGLFAATDHDLRPGMLSTACWRGYWCRYTLRRGFLTLTTVHLGRASPSGPASRLFGVKPHVVPAPAIDAGAWQYRRLDARIPFTGRLLVGAHHIHVDRLAMGFAPAWSYRRVHELRFTQGRLTSTHNRSAQLATVRARLGAEALRPAAGETTEAWIHRAFSLDFRYSWPPVRPDRRTTPNA